MMRIKEPTVESGEGAFKYKNSYKNIHQNTGTAAEASNSREFGGPKNHKVHDDHPTQFMQRPNASACPPRFHQNYRPVYPPVRTWESPVFYNTPPFRMPYRSAPVNMHPPPVFRTPVCVRSPSSMPIMNRVPSRPLTNTFPRLRNPAYFNQFYMYPEPNVYTAEANTSNSSVPNSSVSEKLNNSQEKESFVDMESYTTLPRRDFPSARSVLSDPNPVIDQLCTVKHLYQKHLPWLLDLEFGVRVEPPKDGHIVPIYDVRSRHIVSKSNPFMLHPDFESCDKGFKDIIILYYDSIIFGWYKGFNLYCPNSTPEKFNSWLQKGMQMHGLCWP